MMDIMYKTNDGDFDTTRIAVPNDKTVLLQGSFNNGSNAYMKLARVRVIDKTISYRFVGEYNLNEKIASTGNTIFIIHVIGYA